MLAGYKTNIMTTPDYLVFFYSKANNNKFLESLTKVPNKSNYIFQDVERAAAYYKVQVHI